MTHAPGPQRPPLDLSFCDREPIHIPGAIQPHGVLLAVEVADLAIVQVSGNCEPWLGRTPETVLGLPFDELLIPESVAPFRECLAECGETTSSLRTLQFALENGDSVAYCASAHRSGDLVIVELERRPVAEALEDQTLLGQFRIANRRLGLCQSVEALCQAITQELHRLTGYDRIMVYQFDQEWNGSVIAEHCLECQDPYLGLHYPATDIPAPARAMFLRNGLRLIPDAQYQPAPLHPPQHPRTGMPLDLSRAQLRSVSPIHVEYLRNMEVRASLTISLIVDGSLWGLIACHHRTPRFPSPLLREVCELFGQTVSKQLTECVRSAGQQQSDLSRAVLARLAERVQKHNAITPALIENHVDFLALANAQGAVLWRDGEGFSVGQTPPPKSLALLQQWVANTNSDHVFFTDRLPKAFPAAEPYANVASGVLALVLTRSPDLYIFWFRPEVIQTVSWAGDPSKSTEPVGVDGRLHPRRSFALWKESVRYRSLPWLKCEIEAVRQLRAVLQDRLARSAEQLGRLLPICAWCRKVRSDESYWQQVEAYISQHTDIRFTHGICPDCYTKQLARFDDRPGIGNGRVASG